MSSASFPQRKGPSGPKAPPLVGGGTIIRIGFDNSIDRGNYANDGGVSDQPILRDNAQAIPLQVPLTGYKPGNVILIQWTVVLVDPIASGPAGINMNLVPTLTIDGVTPRKVHLGIVALFAGFQTFAGYSGGPMGPPNTGSVAIVPVPAEVTATPVVKLIGNFFGADSPSIPAYQALLWAAEIDAGSVTQLPTMYLDP